jgi:hypothetical protein
MRSRKIEIVGPRRAFLVRIRGTKKPKRPKWTASDWLSDDQLIAMFPEKTPVTRRGLTRIADGAYEVREYRCA